MKNQSQTITNPLLLDRKKRCSTDAISRQCQGDISESTGIVQNAGVSANYIGYIHSMNLSWNCLGFSIVYSGPFTYVSARICSEWPKLIEKIMNRRCRMRLFSSYHNQNHNVTQRPIKPNSFEHELFYPVAKSGAHKLFPNVYVAHLILSDSPGQTVVVSAHFDNVSCQETDSHVHD